jgi:hypothetical protein
MHYFVPWWRTIDVPFGYSSTASPVHCTDETAPQTVLLFAMTSFSCKVAARSNRGNSHNIVCINSLSFYITGIDSLPSTMKYSQAIAFHVSTCCQHGSEHCIGLQMGSNSKSWKTRTNDAAPDPNVRTVAVLPWRCFVDSVDIFFHMNCLFTSVALVAAFALSFPVAAIIALVLVENR